MLRIHNSRTGKHYDVSDPSECRDKTDRSAAESALAWEDVITMGEVVVEPLPCDKN